MAFEQLGEFQVEHGFGLPIKTTIERVAYEPPQIGYQVYDSDEDAIYVWDVSQAWAIVQVGQDLDLFVSKDGDVMEGDLDFEGNGADLNLSMGSALNINQTVFNSDFAQFMWANTMVSMDGQMSMLTLLNSTPMGDDVDNRNVVLSNQGIRLSGVFDAQAIPVDDRATANLTFAPTAGQDVGVIWESQGNSRIYTGNKEINAGTGRGNATDIRIATAGQESILRVGVDVVEMVNPTGYFSTTIDSQPRELTTKDYVDGIASNLTAGQVTVLDDLNDVVITTPTTDHALMHNGSEFVNRVLAKSDLSDFVETDYVHTTGDETITGNKTFSDTVTVNDLVVTGTTTSVNTTDLEITDNKIEINSGETGAGVSHASGVAGIAINRGTEAAQNIIFDESDDTWKVGEDGALRAIATTMVQEFDAADWTAGTSNTYVLAQATHGLPVSSIYDVTVFKDGKKVGIEVEVDATTGDVTLITAGATFTGAMKVSL